MLLEIDGFELVYANLFIDGATVLSYATQKEQLAEISKNLALHNIGNNFVGLSK